jgi:hypothetical protein
MRDGLLTLGSRRIVRFIQSFFRRFNLNSGIPMFLASPPSLLYWGAKERRRAGAFFSIRSRRGLAEVVEAWSAALSRIGNDWWHPWLKYLF